MTVEAPLILQQSLQNSNEQCSTDQNATDAGVVPGRKASTNNTDDGFGESRLVVDSADNLQSRRVALYGH